MIHEIGRELFAKLQANGDPLAVIDGPEAASTATWGRERIVIEHDSDAADKFDVPRGLHTNPKHRRSALEACKITIYARSVVSGATAFEHRERAKKLRDDVICALDLVAAERRNRWALAEGRFITPAALEQVEKQPGGAAYQLKFAFEQPVQVRTFAGAKKAEALIAHVTSKTKVSRHGAPDDDDNPNTPPASSETACGEA